MPGTVIPLRSSTSGHVAVRFGFHDLHPKTRQPLREWISDVANAEWDAESRSWVVGGFRSHDPAVTLTEAGLDVSEYAKSHLQQARASGSTDQIPEWFGRAGGISLFPYQAVGAVQVARGRSLLADAPGVGKTIQALAAQAVVGATRIVILCPPLVIAHWAREVLRSGLVTPEGCAFPGDDSGTEGIVQIVAGSKAIELPERGVVIVGDSLFTMRMDLQNQLTLWRPNGLIYDEAHRAKTWTSKRSVTSREFAASVRTNTLPDGRPGLTIPATGTPMFASPAELAGVLAVAGKLDDFGGHWTFLNRYARKQTFPTPEGRPPRFRWVARMDRLPELREKLEEIWVRRTKDEVLPDLPTKLRYEIPVDATKSKLYKTAYKEVRADIDDWLSALTKRKKFPPNSEMVDEFVGGNLGMISRLRRAAGLTKLPALIEWVTEHLDGNPVDVETGTYPRPLLVWTHHQEVRDGLLEALEEAGLADRNLVRECTGPVRVIEGTTKLADRNTVESDFQDGRVAILIGSIQAAGVGITLTRGSDQIFLESDFSVSVNVQAEDRQHRVGASATHLNIGSLVALGTLDEQVHSILTRKADVLDTAIGGDNQVSAHDPSADQGSTARRILTDLVDERIRAREAKSKRSTPA